MCPLTLKGIVGILIKVSKGQFSPNVHSPMQTINHLYILLSPVCTYSANRSYDLDENFIYYKVDVFCELADSAVVLCQGVNSLTTQRFAICPVYGQDHLFSLVHYRTLRILIWACLVLTEAEKYAKCFTSQFCFSLHLEGRKMEMPCQCKAMCVVSYGQINPWWSFVSVWFSERHKVCFVVCRVRRAGYS